MSTFSQNICLYHRLLNRWHDKFKGLKFIGWFKRSLCFNLLLISLMIKSSNTVLFMWDFDFDKTVADGLCIVKYSLYIKPFY